MHWSMLAIWGVNDHRLDSSTWHIAPRIAGGQNSMLSLTPHADAQRIEAPVRGGEGAPGQIPDGGPPVSERLGQIDQILINNDGADERAILGNGGSPNASSSVMCLSPQPIKAAVRSSPLFWKLPARLPHSCRYQSSVPDCALYAAICSAEMR